MPKGPRFKRGFTWRHHFDEWWDRRPQEWKARLFVGVVLGGIFSGIFLFLWGSRWMERNELLTDGKRIRQSRIEASDKLMVPKEEPAAMPGFRNPTQVETRVAE